MKKTNVEEFLENCSDEQIKTLLLFTKAQLQDRLDAAILNDGRKNPIQ